MNWLMEIYIKVYRWMFPKMPSEVFYECRKDLELFEKLCREDIMDERFTILSSYLGLYTVFDNENYEPLAYWEITDLMNKLVKENEQLKSDNFNLNKSVECLDETVKEQCNKIDWADECGVRWEEEYEKWKG